MNFIKLNTFLKEKLGVFYIPVISFIAALTWTFLTSYFISTFNKGYLSYFNIATNLPINEINSSSVIIMIIFYSVIILCSFLSIYLLQYFLIKSKLKQYRNWKIVLWFLLFFLLCTLTIFIMVTFVFLYWLKFIYNYPIFDILMVLFSIDTFWIIVVILAIYTVFILAFLYFMDYLNTTSSSQKYNNKWKDMINKTDTNIKNSVALLSGLTAISLLIFLLNGFFLELGKLNASMEYMYPSLTIEEKEYIIIGQTNCNCYLMIDTDTLSEDNVKYIIQDIEGYELSTKLKSELSIEK